MKKIILIATLLFIGDGLLAQDYIDNALLFSRTQPIGSARMMGIGGTHSALGGDYSAAVFNPAGLGMYNRNEFTLTPSLNFLNSTSSYQGVSSPKELRSVFSLPGFSLSLHNPSEKGNGFMGGTFSVSFMRLNDFNQDFRYQAANDQNSIIDFFIEDAQQVDPDVLLNEYSLTGLAYNNYLIEENYDENDNVVGYGTVLNFSKVRQEEISERKGAQSQWSIAYGANFNDKLFVGASLGIASIRYKLSQTFTEDEFGYNEGAPNALNDFVITEQYDIRGTGVNFSLGAIYRVKDFIQVGASFVTPTYYGITDKYHARIDSHWNNFEYYEDEVLNDVYQEFPEEVVDDYKITTPLKANVGIAFISKMGFVSFNAEYVDYGNAKYSSSSAGDFKFENEDIQSLYESVFNYTIGAEYRKDIMRFRLGANYMSDPYALNSDLDRSIKTASAGFGVRLNNFYTDLAVNHSWSEGRRIPYFTLVGSADPEATLDFKNTRYTLTFGFTF